MNSAVRMASESPAPPRARAVPRAWVVLAILCSVYIINFLDRQLLSILAKPIQQEPGVLDFYWKRSASRSSGSRVGHYDLLPARWCLDDRSEN